MKRILLVSYYFPPFPGVGSMRPEYWAKHLSSYGWKPTVLTNTIQPKEKKYGFDVEFIPNRKQGLFSRIASYVIKDKGLEWLSALKRYIKENKHKYDVVLLTGGPFMHFLAVKEIKKQSSIPIILDYRDPFSSNPRMNDGFLKHEVKVRLENYINSMADYCITVNDTCAKKLKGINKERVVVVSNGFDESLFTTRSYDDFLSFTSESINLIYPGKIYHDFELDKFLKNVEELDSVNVTFIGSNIPINNNSSISVYDRMEYTDVLQMVRNADVGVVLTGGESFESPTKLFDYIGCKKPILIVTEKSLYSGEIFEITKNLDNVVWANNDIESIKTGIKKLKQNYNPEYDTINYSRKYNFSKLVNLLNLCL